VNDWLLYLVTFTVGDGSNDKHQIALRKREDTKLLYLINAHKHYCVLHILSNIHLCIGQHALILFNMDFLFLRYLTLKRTSSDLESVSIYLLEHKYPITSSYA
jgi:hypothetical protein